MYGVFENDFEWVNDSKTKFFVIEKLIRDGINVFSV